MANAVPSKVDITSIFKRLRGISTNKQCFDCRALNPTWASVTYGVFLCLDCSAVHRSLGVHVTFIRSTQLDTNWTWLQLRAMQVGGNANASAFFRQHGCVTQEAQQKYHSRAAQMYREKLHASALKAVKQHGTKVHIDSVISPPPETKDRDFFFEHSTTDTKNGTTPLSVDTDAANEVSQPVAITNGNLAHTEQKQDEDDGRVPNVEVALSMSPRQALQEAEPRKATIGGRKPAAAKKSGMGAKKGFGAQKVKSNFAEIESQAAQRDKEREDMAANLAQQEIRTKEQEQKHIASLKLAYKDLSLEEKRREDQMKKMDPKKAEQMERLGMGFTGTRGVSHSAMSNMQTIDQETPTVVKTASSYDHSRSRRAADDDDFDMLGLSTGPPKYSDSPFGLKSEDRYSNWSKSTSKKSSWDDLDALEKSSTRDELTPGQSQSDDRGRSRKNFEVSQTTDAQNKFGSAKSISSDQYFGNRDPDFETRQALSKYDGSSSISSAQLFGRDDAPRHNNYSSGPDLSEIKDGVKQGVTKVAGKLSNLANGVMNTIQDHYG